MLQPFHYASSSPLCMFYFNRFFVVSADGACNGDDSSAYSQRRYLSAVPVQGVHIYPSPAEIEKCIWCIRSYLS